MTNLDRAGTLGVEQVKEAARRQRRGRRNRRNRRNRRTRQNGRNCTARDGGPGGVEAHWVGGGSGIDHCDGKHVGARAEKARAL